MADARTAAEPNSRPGQQRLLDGLLNPNPKPDAAMRRATNLPWLAYSAYRWFVLTGQPPTPDDWEHADGWPDPFEVEEAFGDFERMLDVTGVLDSPMVMVMRAVATVHGELEDQREELDRQGAELQREREREHRQLQAEQDRLRAREADLERRARTATEKADAARNAQREVEGRVRTLDKQLTRAGEHARELGAELEQARAQAVMAGGDGQLAYRSNLWFPGQDLDALLRVAAQWLARGEHADQVRGIAEDQPLSVALGTGETLSGARRGAVARLRQQLRFAGRDDLHIISCLDLYATASGAGAKLDLLLQSTRAGTSYPRLRLPALPARLLEAFPAAPDGDWQMSEQPRHLHGDDGAAELAAQLESRLRDLPVVVLAGARLDPDRLARELAGVAHVASLDAAGCRALTALVGEELSVWGGAVRCYLPGLHDVPEHAHWVIPRHAAEHVARTAEQITRRIAGASALLGEPEMLKALRGTTEPPAAAPSPPVKPTSEPEAGGADLLEDLQRELEAERAKSSALARSVSELATRSADTPGEASADVAPQTVLQAAELAAGQARHLRFAPKAFETAADSPFGRPQAVLEALERLDELAGRFAAGDMGQSLADAAAELGLQWRGGVSRITASRNPDKYAFRIDGHDIAMGPHVVVGSGRGANRCARIYLAAPDGTGDLPRGLVVGHIGRHLPDSTTS